MMSLTQWPKRSQTHTREKISKKLRERKTEELKMWGYDDGGSAEPLVQAEACA